MEAIEIKNGYKTAFISKWNHLFVVAGLNGGSTKTFKTLEGATRYAKRYVGL